MQPIPVFVLESEPKEPYEIVPGTAHFRHSSFETAVTYERSNGHEVQMTLVHSLHLHPGDEPALVVAVMQIDDNPNCEFSEQVTLSIPELRLLRDLLNRHEITAYLETLNR
jgi:hypothetical protein